MINRGGPAQLISRLVNHSIITLAFIILLLPHAHAGSIDRSTWHILPVDSLPDSIAEPFSCVPTLSSMHGSCMGHGQCMIVFDITANSSSQFIDQSSVNSTSIHDVDIQLNGIKSSDQLPMAICLCDEGYRSHTDLYQIRANEHSNCGTPESTVLGLLITSLLLALIGVIVASFKLFQWWRWHRIVIHSTKLATVASSVVTNPRSPRSKPVNLALPRRSIKAALSNRSFEGQFQPVSCSARVAPVPLPATLELAPTQTGDMRMEEVPARSIRQSINQSINQTIRPARLSQSAPITATVASELPSPKSDKKQLSSILSPSLASPAARSATDSSTHQIIKLPSKSKLIWKHITMLQFLHPLCCFFGYLSALIGMSIRLSTHYVLGRDIGLSTYPYFVYQFIFLGMCIAQYHNAKLTVNMLGKKFTLNTKLSLHDVMLRVKRILVVGWILNTIAATSFFIMAIPDIDQVPWLMVIATVGNAPFCAIGLVTIFTTRLITKSLNRGLSTLSQVQQNDRLKVKQSIGRYARQVVFTIAINIVVTLLFVCVPFFRLYHQFFVLATFFLFVFVGCGRMMLLKVPSIERRKENRGVQQPVISTVPTANNKTNPQVKRLSSVMTKKSASVSPGFTSMSSSQRPDEMTNTLSPAAVPVTGNV